MDSYCPGVFPFGSVLREYERKGLTRLAAKAGREGKLGSEEDCMVNLMGCGWMWTR